MSDEKIFIKLTTGVFSRLFRSAYAYVDTLDNYADRVMAQRGLRIRKKNVFIRNDGSVSTCIIVLATIRKKYSSLFEECMDRHQKNSILLGWGNTKEYGEVVRDIHRLGE